MNNFSIKDIENLCGIKAHTLRIWEQRYKSLFCAKRKDSKHRTYDCNDLKELLRISFLYHNGFKISRIAEMSCEEIQQLVEKTCNSDCNHEVSVQQLLTASIDLDKERFEKIINSLVLRFGLDKCITHIFYPFLQRIGLLWMTGNLIPAQEHFSSHIICKKIIVATDGLEPPYSNAYTIAIFAPLGEFHELPLLVANYFFRKNNIQTIYFGTDVALDTLCYYDRQNSITHLYAHVITNLNNPELDGFACALSNRFSDKEIIFSGPACKCIEQRKPANLRMLYSMDELIALTKEMGSKVPVTA